MKKVLLFFLLSKIVLSEPCVTTDKINTLIADDKVRNFIVLTDPQTCVSMPKLPGVKTVYDTLLLKLTLANDTVINCQDVIVVDVEINKDGIVDKSVVNMFLTDNGPEIYCNRFKDVRKVNDNYYNYGLECVMDLTVPPVFLFEKDTIAGFCQGVEVHEYTKRRETENGLIVNAYKIYDKTHTKTGLKITKYSTYKEISSFLNESYHEYVENYINKTNTPYPPVKMQEWQIQHWKKENDWVWDSMEKYNTYTGKIGYSSLSVETQI